MVFRLMNYFSFVLSSLLIGTFKAGKQDVVLCESPPLFLGISALWLKWIKGSKLIFNVSDLWPESAERLGLVKNRFFLGAATRLEEFIYRNSWLISGQTQGIVRDISERIPGKKVFWLKNGVDIDLYDTARDFQDWKPKLGYHPSDFVLVYAGILGYAQGLDVIINAAEILKPEQSIKFLFVGSGPEKARLEALVKSKGLDNVKFLPVVSKREIAEIVWSINAAVIPLKKLDIFKGAIPSKIFENLILKKPILLGVEGEAKELFIDQGKCGLSFEPEDHIDLAEKIMTLFNSKEQCRIFGENGFSYVREHFSRDDIAAGFDNFIKENYR